MGAALWLSIDPAGAQYGGLQPGEARATSFSSVAQRPTIFALRSARPPPEASPLLMLAADALEVGIDRPGMDYQNFDLPAPDPAPCRAACEKDGRCRAFTYVKPRIQGPNARCWLKTAIPDPRPNGCCIPGIKDGSVAEPLAPPRSGAPRPPPPLPSPSPPAISPIQGAWRLTSTCDKWLPGNELWGNVLILFEAADGSLSGSAVNDRLRSELKPDSTGYGPPVKSRRSDNSITLVLHPADWKSILVLNGRFDGSAVAGAVHHMGTDDCSFHMVRGGG
ncbi:MAG: PAN domain-containing protein [Hyphomicrobiales bacterium]